MQVRLSSPASQVLIVSKYLVTQFVCKLVEAQVDFSLHFIIEKLFFELSEGIECTVVVQVQRVQYTSEEKKKRKENVKIIQSQSKQKKLRATYCLD